MFLSNLRPCFAIFGLFAAIICACGPSPSNVGSTPAQLPEVRSKFPFQAKEPSIFQAAVIVSGSGFNKKWFVARNNDASRIDHYIGNDVARIEVRGARSYSILPTEKIYVDLTDAKASVPNDSSVIDQISRQYFAGVSDRSFVSSGTEGNLTIYTSQPKTPNESAVTVWVDQLSGMIVKEEIRSQSGDNIVTFELKDLKLEADASLFAIPHGFKKVTQSEFDRVWAAK